MVELAEGTAIPLFIISGYLLFICYLPRETPPDTDSANHMRLAQLWINGIKPMHPYGVGVKWALPRAYYLFFPFISRNWNLHRLLNVAQATLTHLVVPHLGLPDDVPTSLVHLALFLLNISPLIFPLTSSLEVGAVALIWFAMSTLSFDGDNSVSLVLAAIGIATIALLSKIVDFLYALPLGGIVLFGLLSPGAVWGAVSLLTLILVGAAFAVRLKSLKEKIYRFRFYRATRLLLRKKVIWPAVIFLAIAFTLLAFSMPAVSETLGRPLVVMMMIIALVRNIVSGDFATGPGAYHLYFALLVFSISAGTLLLVIFVSIFLLTDLATFSFAPSREVGNRMRLISQGGRFPTNSGKLGHQLNFCRQFLDQDSTAFVIGSDSLLALNLNAQAKSGYAYTSVHSSQWGARRIDAQKLLDGGALLIVSQPLGADLEELSGLRNADFRVDATTDVTVVLPATHTSD